MLISIALIWAFVETRRVLPLFFLLISWIPDITITGLIFEKLKEGENDD